MPDVVVVSSDDAALMRLPGGHRFGVTLNAAPKTVVATARIDQSVFSYPVAQLTVANTIGWPNVKVGQAVWIGTEPGTRDITAGVVRKTPTSTILYIDAKSLGETGYAQFIHRGLAYGQYITILKHRPPWGLISSIRGGVFYKAWDVAYTDEGSNPNPVARIGNHRAMRAGSGGTAVLTFTAAPFTWGAKTITGHSWNIDGGTVIGGSLTSTSVTTEFAPGWYVVEYTVTDSGSKTHTAFRYVWVNPYNDSGAGASFGSRFKWDITRDEQRDGRDIELAISGEITQDDVYPGQPFLLTEGAKFNNAYALANDDSRVHTFIGYAALVNPSRKQRVVRRVNVTLQSPLTAMRAVPTAPQLLQEKDSPVNWAEATSTLSNPVGGLWYILQHHAPTFLAAHDFYFSAAAAANREQSLKFQQDTLLGQVKALEDTLPGHFGCRSDGTMKLIVSAVHQDNDYRNAMPTKMIWEGSDVDGDDGIDYPFNFQQRAGLVKGYALAYDGGAESRPYASLAPGKSQGQAAGKPQVTFIVPPSDAVTEQARVDELTGHAHAKENAPYPEIGFTAFRNLDIAEPADRDVWHVLNIPAELDPYGVGFVAQRALASRVSRRWSRNSNGTLTKKIRQEFELETFGQPGVAIPVEREGWESWVGDEGWIQNDVPFDPKIELESNNITPNFIITFDEESYLYYTLYSGLVDPPTSPTTVAAGNDGLSARGGETGSFTPLGTIALEINIDLDPVGGSDDHIIHAIQFDYKRLLSGVSSGATMRMYYDIYSNSAQVYVSPDFSITSAWQTHYVATSISNARTLRIFIVLELSEALTVGTCYGYLDNIMVEFT